MISAFDNLVELVLVSGVEDVARLALVLLLCVAAFCLFWGGSTPGGKSPGDIMLRVST
jgi:hypothetical protein